MIPSTLRTRCLWVIAVGTLAFALLAWQVQSGGALSQLDQGITGWMQAQRNPALQAPLFAVTDLHSTWGIGVMRPIFDLPLLSLSTYSFPSGHAAGSTLLYASAIIVFAHTRWLHRLIGLGCTMVMLTAFSRVYLGAHYLSDVIAGVCVGLVWAHGCRLLLDGSLRD